jgi:hypothetical protein
MTTPGNLHHANYLKHVFELGVLKLGCWSTTLTNIVFCKKALGDMRLNSW